MSSNFSRIRKNTAKIDEKANEKRLALCIPIAREVLDVMAQDMQLHPMGEIKPNEDAFHKTAVKILEIYMKHDLPLADFEFVLQLALQPISQVKDIVVNSTNRNFQIALSGLMGKQMTDVKASDLDGWLKAGDVVSKTTEADEEAAEKAAEEESKTSEEKPAEETTETESVEPKSENVV